MKNEINAVLENMTTATPEPEDYTGEDGLLYCGRCRGRVRLPESRPRGTGGRREAAQAP